MKYHPLWLNYKNTENGTRKMFNQVPILKDKNRAGISRRVI